MSALRFHKTDIVIVITSFIVGLIVAIRAGHKGLSGEGVATVSGRESASLKPNSWGGRTSGENKFKLGNIIFDQGENYHILGVDANLIGRSFAWKIFEEWPEARLEEYVAGLERPANERVAVLHGAAWTILAKRNPEKAAALLSNSSDFVREFYLNNVAAGCLASNVEIGLKVLEGAENKERLAKEVFSIVSQAVSLEPGCLNQLLKSSSSFSKELTLAVLKEAISAGAASYDDVKSYNDSEQLLILEGLASSQSMSIAFVSTELLPSLNSRELSIFLSKFLQRHPAETVSLLENLPANEKSEAAKFLLAPEVPSFYTPDDVYLKIFRLLDESDQKTEIKHLAQKVDFTNALDVVEPLGDTYAVELASHSFASRMKNSSDRRKVIEEAASLSDPSQRVAALTSAAREWARTEPNTAANYILQADLGSLQLDALEPVIEQWERIDKEGLGVWLSAIAGSDDQSLNDSSLKTIYSLAEKNDFVRHHIVRDQ